MHLVFFTFNCTSLSVSICWFTVDKHPAHLSLFLKMSFKKNIIIVLLDTFECFFFIFFAFSMEHTSLFHAETESLGNGVRLDILYFIYSVKATINKKTLFKYNNCFDTKHKDYLTKLNPFSFFLI